MTITDAMSTAMSGMQAASVKLNIAASNIANLQSPGSNGDLANDVVQLSLASTLYTANAAVVRASSQMTGTLLDMFHTSSGD